jgi:hypothetical protein
MSRLDVGCEPRMMRRTPGRAEQMMMPGAGLGAAPGIGAAPFARRYAAPPRAEEHMMKPGVGGTLTYLKYFHIIYILIFI